MKIPGIGRAGAQAIISYRDKLGGYYDISQIKEIRFIADSAIEHLFRFAYIDTSVIEKIDINKASVSFMKKHPYINFYQAKCIVDYRKRKFLNNIDELKFSQEFNSEDFRRLFHYIEYGENK